MDMDESKKLAALLDKAIMSDKEQVQSMLQELLMVVALTEKGGRVGPFESMRKDIAVLREGLDSQNRAIRELMAERNRNIHDKNWDLNTTGWNEIYRSEKERERMVRGLWDSKPFLEPNTRFKDPGT